jgi:hypothetical protein
MQINESSPRYSPHGNGYIKVYRKLLTSAVFQSERLLKIWIWCLIRANWHEATCFFEGKEIPLEQGQFITGRFAGSDECGMNAGTFYKCIKKLEEIGNITIKSDNKKSIISIVNYSSYQGDIIDEWQQRNNKGTTKEQQSNTDKEYKNKRSKEYTYTSEKSRPKSILEAKEYFLTIDGKNEDASAWFDYFESNGWKIAGKAPMKDWKASARTWMRNKGKFNGNISKSTNPNSAISRATFKHDEASLNRLKELKESLDERDRERRQRA